MSRLSGCGILRPHITREAILEQTVGGQSLLSLIPLLPVVASPVFDT